MDSLGLGLILGLIWALLWFGRLVFYHVPHASYVEGGFEFLITGPLGLAFIYDWIAFRRKKLPGFLQQPNWNFSDYSFFCSGFAGFSTLVYYTLAPSGTTELKTMGTVGLAIGIIHWFRRRYRMKA